MLKIYAIGGYSQIGKNMTAVQYNDEIIILDCGFWMEKIMSYEGEENAASLPVESLYKYEIVPDDRKFFEEHGKQVKAIFSTHAHLDHCAAIPALAGKYKCPVIATPFTIEVIKRLASERKEKTPRLIKMKEGNFFEVSKNVKVEFIHVTHSTIQTVIIAVHTPDGIIVYANDWRFDENPIIEKKTNYARLKKISKEGVLALITDSTRVDDESKTFSEATVRSMFLDILPGVNNKKNLLIVTTFASHIERIRTILDMAKKLNRKPIILGTSMSNYINAAEKIGVTNFSKEAQIVRGEKNINKIMRKINKNRGEYLIICTGNQGEPNAVLTRIARNEFDLNLMPKDAVIFSSRTIPSPINVAQRADLERKLRNKGVRIITDVHVSGHAGREDQREILEILKPKHYIPTHGGMVKLASAVDLAGEEGYELGKTSHILQDGQSIVLIK